MPNKALYFTDEEYGFLLAIAAKEYPEGDKRLQSPKGKRKNVDPVSRLIQEAALDKAKELAVKHKVKIPKTLKGESKA